MLLEWADASCGKKCEWVMGDTPYTVVTTRAPAVLTNFSAK